MMKFLHSADWHLDAPMTGLAPDARERLRREVRQLPEKIARLCKTERCDLLLLAGDLFDGPYTKESLTAVRSALAGLEIPVVISPGNHDFCDENSPYTKEEWPQNVHIFRQPEVERYPIEALNCVIYGAGYKTMDCPALLKGFRAGGDEKWHIGLFHADPLSSNSPYCPVTKAQALESALDYLALGHVHKAGSFRAGDTLCAWPGCPMGHGYDELGAKGVLIGTMDEKVEAQFVPLDTPRFYDLEEEAGEDAAETLRLLLPGVPSSDFYRITLTGYSAGLSLEALREAFSHIPNLILRDETRPEMDLWSGLGSDTLEGVYFAQLYEHAQSGTETLSRRARLAARISRQILDGQEVKLP